jgi:hypothetical protein
MNRNDPFILIPRDAGAKIRQSGLDYGELGMRHVKSDSMYVVAQVEVSRGLHLPVSIPREYEALRWEGPHRAAAHWQREQSGRINLQNWFLRKRPGTAIPFSDFKRQNPRVIDPGNLHGILITHDPDVVPELADIGVGEFAAWLIHRDGVRPIDVQVEPDVLGLAQLAGLWPTTKLAANSVMLVGCGSIGSAAAEAFAGYGVGRLELVDPDRFLWHNVVRHSLGPESVGRHKVSALKTHLNKHWCDIDVRARCLDVAADAHYIRRVCKDVDLILCTADGIAPRRVVSHLARLAGKTAVLACVLDHGAIGEIIRLRPTPRFGCLLCLRHELAGRDAMDAEADQELDYGTGEIHQPMTAVPPDLRYLGTFAAKVSVATILQSLHGDHTQRLPNEHAILGLNPRGDLAAPFDVNKLGVTRWLSLPPPRPDCPTCQAA